MKGLDLFDSVGIDLRPQVREYRRKKSKELAEFYGVYKLTLEEYAEQVVCNKPFSELTEHEIREVGRHIYRGKYGYDFLKYDAPLKEHIELAKAKIADRVAMYEESGGKYGKQGLLSYTRKVVQAVRLGLDVPDHVLDQPIIKDLLREEK